MHKQQPGYNSSAYNAKTPYGRKREMAPKSGTLSIQSLPMPMPSSVPPGCPSSLAFLAHIDGLVVQQEHEPLEPLFGIETANTYRLLNRMGERVFYAMEESEGCDRQCSYARRSFVMHIVDNTGVEVIRCSRPYVPCCKRQSIRIESPPGNVVAFVRDTSCCGVDYQVVDANSAPQFKIRGPGSCNVDRVYQVFDMSLAPIGEIRKRFSGFVQDASADADNFGVSFPPTLSVQMKAALIGTAFLIDFMYFEHDDE